MANNTNTAGREALQAYLKDCDAHAIVPDVGGAWHAAFQAGRASLAPSGFDAADTNTAEREAFEAWCIKQGRSIKRAIEEYSHEYESTMVQNDWEVWQACAKAMRGFDAADMATASAQGFRDGVASLAASAGSEPVAPEDYAPLLDDEGRMMVGTSHHYTAENIRALVRQLRRFADPQQSTQADWDALDWRGWCNVLGRIVAALADEVPVTHPYPPGGKAGWMPIATAPKGNPLKPGPRFLLFVKGVGAALGHVYDDGCGGFFANADGYSGNWEITHWMPLPPAPPLPASEAKEL